MSITKKDYINYLISAFNECKNIIKEGKREVAIQFEKKSSSKYLVYNIPAFENNPEINIYSISAEKFLHSEYIHLSGVNVLFFIAALYLRVEKNNVGIYHEYTKENEYSKVRERTEILKQTSFILKKDEKGFWYYPISELKSTELFNFDLPKLNSSSNTND